MSEEPEQKIPVRPKEDSGAGGKYNAVQTYASDMAKVIDSNSEAGLVKKIIHQEQEYEIKKSSMPPQIKKNKFFLWGGIVFLFLAVATLAFFIFKKDINTVDVASQFVPLIFTDKSIYMEVAGMTKDEISQTILKEVNGTTVKKKGIEGIYLTENKQIVGLRRFITLIKSSFVPESNPILVSDNFLAGVMNNETKDFFILIKVRSIADVFESMKNWENKMFFDLHGFFGVDISPQTNYLLTKNLEDGIIANKNSRILYRNEEDINENPLAPKSKIVMMYVFADENSVIITNTDLAAREVILRLSSGQNTE